MSMFRFKARRTAFFLVATIAFLAVTGCDDGSGTNKIGVTGISLDTTAETLVPGSTHQIIPTITPDNASDKGVTYESSAEAIASVSADGLITALTEGMATITATASGDTTKTATVAITVKIGVTGISLDTTTETLVLGSTGTAITYQLIPTITPDNASNKGVTYESSAETIASVSESGLITALAEGMATITATASGDTSKTATVAITVTPYISAVFQQWQGKTITLDNAGTNANISIEFQNDGKTIHFSLTFKQVIAGNKDTMGYLTGVSNYAISDQVSVDKLFEDNAISGATKELHHYETSEDYIRINLAGNVIAIYQFLAQFNQDGTYKAVAMGNPSIAPATTQSPCDSDLAGVYKLDMTDSAYTESTCP